MLLPVEIEPGTLELWDLWCLPDWGNLASVNWGIFNLLVHFCANWLLNLDHCGEINRPWLYKNLKNLSLTSNGKLAQSGRQKKERERESNTRDPKFLGSQVQSLLEVNFLLNLFCSSLHKPLVYMYFDVNFVSLWKTRLTNCFVSSADSHICLSI